VFYLQIEHELGTYASDALMVGGDGELAAQVADCIFIKRDG